MIVCIGDVMVDVFPDGDVPRRHPGGKAAIYAVTARTLGQDAAVIGCVGPDDDGKNVLGALSKAGVDVSTLHVRVGEATGADYFEGGDWRMERGGNWALTAADVCMGLTTLREGANVDAVMVNQGIAWEAAQEAVRFAREHDLFTVLHLGPEAIEPGRKVPAGNYPLADTIAVSLREATVLAEHLGLDIAGASDEELARILFDATRPRAALLLSRGVDGAHLVVRNGETVGVAAVAGREVRNRTPEFFIGAGDVMLAAWVTQLVRAGEPVVLDRAITMLDRAADLAATTLDVAGPLTAALTKPERFRLNGS